MNQKLKSWLLNDRLFYGFLGLLVGLVSFLLGAQMVSPPSAPVVSPSLGREQNLATSARVPITAPQTNVPKDEEVGAFVASRSGTRYHLPTCPGAKQIKEENKIFFASSAAAEAAGYKRAANCP